MKCEFCDYEWEPNKEKPKQCPFCKRYIKYKTKKCEVKKDGLFR